MTTTAQPTTLTILASLRATRESDADARFRDLVGQQAPDLVPVIFGAA